MTKRRTTDIRHMFGSAKGGAAQQKRTGRGRPLPKLPTSLDEGRQLLGRIIDNQEDDNDTEK